MYRYRLHTYPKTREEYDRRAVAPRREVGMMRPTPTLVSPASARP
jgi:hypothetical protein